METEGLRVNIKKTKIMEVQVDGHALYIERSVVERCICEVRPLVERPTEYAVVSYESLEVVNKFRYLSDVISAGLPPRCFHCAQKLFFIVARPGW